MESNYFDISEIEDSRKKKINKMVSEMIKRREDMNKILEDELNNLEHSYKELVSIDISNQEIQPTPLQSAEFDSKSSMRSNMPIGYNLDTIPEIEQPSTMPDNNSSTPSKIDVPCIDMYIEANIAISDIYLKSYIFTQKYLEIERMIESEKNSVEKNLKVAIKLKINKGLNLLTDDIEKIEYIKNSFNGFERSCTFIENFCVKVIEHSIVKINRCLSTYTRYSRLFCMVYSEELFIFYRVSVLSRKITKDTVKGLYVLYFSVLREMDKLEEAWCFIASVLNKEPVENNQYVVETFIYIFNDYLLCVIPKMYRKLLRYIYNFYINEMSDGSCKFRVKEMIEKLV